jgi:energy-coupling factor transport system substrate-specific component
MVGLCRYAPEVNVRRFFGGIIYALSGAIGILAFIYPFFLSSQTNGSMGIAHGQDAALVTTALVGLALIGLLVELQGQAISAKTVAVLGVMVAITSVLRFVEVAIPMPGGFSPVFAPIILSSYVFGGRFGFLMGTFTMLVSALITGGVGPWLPYQMFTAGWIGMSAGWLSRLLPHTPRPRPSRRWLPRIGRHRPPTMLVLSVFGFIWGLAYGMIINLYFWPFAIGPMEQAWTPGTSLGEALVRYAAFYAATSLGWDLIRAVGNMILILLLGAPTLRALARFQRRFHFEVRSADA